MVSISETYAKINNEQTSAQQAALLLQQDAAKLEEQRGSLSLQNKTISEKYAANIRNEVFVGSHESDLIKKQQELEQAKTTISIVQRLKGNISSIEAITKGKQSVVNTATDEYIKSTQNEYDLYSKDVAVFNKNESQFNINVESYNKKIGVQRTIEDKLNEDIVNYNQKIERVKNIIDEFNSSQDRVLSQRQIAEKYKSELPEDLYTQIIDVATKNEKAKADYDLAVSKQSAFNDYLGKVAEGKNLVQTVDIRLTSRPHPGDPNTLIVEYYGTVDNKLPSQSSYTSGETQIKRGTDWQKQIEDWGIAGAKNYYGLGAEDIIRVNDNVVQASSFSPEQISIANQVFSGRMTALAAYERDRETQKDLLKAGMQDVDRTNLLYKQSEKMSPIDATNFLKTNLTGSYAKEVIAGLQWKVGDVIFSKPDIVEEYAKEHPILSLGDYGYHAADSGQAGWSYQAKIPETNYIVAGGTKDAVTFSKLDVVERYSQQIESARLSEAVAMKNEYAANWWNGLPLSQKLMIGVETVGRTFFSHYIDYELASEDISKLPSFQTEAYDTFRGGEANYRKAGNSYAGGFIESLKSNELLFTGLSAYGAGVGLGAVSRVPVIGSRLATAIGIGMVSYGVADIGRKAYTGDFRSALIEGTEFVASAPLAGAGFKAAGGRLAPLSDFVPKYTLGFKKPVGVLVDMGETQIYERPTPTARTTPIEPWGYTTEPFPQYLPPGRDIGAPKLESANYRAGLQFEQLYGKVTEKINVAEPIKATGTETFLENIKSRDISRNVKNLFREGQTSESTEPRLLVGGTKTRMLNVKTPVVFMGRRLDFSYDVTESVAQTYMEIPKKLIPDFIRTARGEVRYINTPEGSYMVVKGAKARPTITESTFDYNILNRPLIEGGVEYPSRPSPQKPSLGKSIGKTLEWGASKLPRVEIRESLRQAEFTEEIIPERPLLNARNFDFEVKGRHARTKGTSMEPMNVMPETVSDLKGSELRHEITSREFKALKNGVAGSLYAQGKGWQSPEELIQFTRQKYKLSTSSTEKPPEPMIFTKKTGRDVFTSEPTTGMRVATATRQGMVLELRPEAQLKPKTTRKLQTVTVDEVQSDLLTKLKALKVKSDLTTARTDTRTGIKTELRTAKLKTTAETKPDADYLKAFVIGGRAKTSFSIGAELRTSSIKIEAEPRINIVQKQRHLIALQPIIRTTPRTREVPVVIPRQAPYQAPKTSQKLSPKQNTELNPLQKVKPQLTYTTTSKTPPKSPRIPRDEIVLRPRPPTVKQDKRIRDLKTKAGLKNWKVRNPIPELLKR